MPVFRPPASRRPGVCQSDEVQRVIDDHTQGPLLGFIGQPRVNVLMTNRALDALRRPCSLADDLPARHRISRPASRKRGRLKVFLGMSPGVGKTYEMLRAARRRKAEGDDVLVGLVETHGRRETESLLRGLEVLRPQARSTTRAAPCWSSTSTAPSPAGRPCCWSTNTPIPMRPARAIPNAGRTSRRSSRPGSMSGPR